ncbi:Rid family hydrolase [Nocardioides sp. B-3]|uniref:Rid family hydrolase n=1 Tax=Nocardioides sp. B-3 TaxID=2895565 RepID=UPI002153512E|nr:Rid family hydrolase [Nocardioides sp. B-3]UUZ58755.1 hypothetical protein LP418_22085 [Nocardioides sp. B-3]
MVRPPCGPTVTWTLTRPCRRVGAGRSPREALAHLGGTPEDVIRTRQYLVAAEHADAVGAVHGEVFGAILPASTMVVVAALLDDRWLVEVELDAVID